MSDNLIWMTYDEAAQRLGIKPDSVRRRAAARRWLKRMGNDGRASVGIPRDVIPDITPDPIPDRTGDITPDTSDSGIELASAMTEIRMLREQMADIRADRDAWRAQSESLASHARPGRPISIIDRILGRR